MWHGPDMLMGNFDRTEFQGLFGVNQMSDDWWVMHLGHGTYLANSSDRTGKLNYTILSHLSLKNTFHLYGLLVPFYRGKTEAQRSDSDFPKVIWLKLVEEGQKHSLCMPQTILSLLSSSCLSWSIGSEPCLSPAPALLRQLTNSSGLYLSWKLAIILVRLATSPSHLFYSYLPF